MSLKQQFYKKRKEGRSHGYVGLPCPQILGWPRVSCVFKQTPSRGDDEDDGESEGGAEAAMVKVKPVKPVAQDGSSREGPDWPSGLEIELRGHHGGSQGPLG